MGLEKRPSAQAGTVTVVFRVPPEAAATSAALLGEFSDWSPVAMDSSADGGYEAAVDLRSGSTYRFRYLLDGERWVNDWAADGYVANDYGSDDSVVDLTAVAPAPAKKAATRAAPKAAKATKRPAKKAAAPRKKSSAPND